MFTKGTPRQSWSWLWAQINITRLRQIVLDNSLLEDAAATQGESNQAACDEGFTRTLSRCGGTEGVRTMLRVCCCCDVRLFSCCRCSVVAVTVGLSAEVVLAVLSPRVLSPSKTVESIDNRQTTRNISTCKVPFNCEHFTSSYTCYRCILNGEILRRVHAIQMLNFWHMVVEYVIRQSTIES